VKDDEVVALFTFPEFDVAFAPRHGDVLCFRAASYEHCTRGYQRKNLLGLAFFQKASLLRQLGKLSRPADGGVLEHHIPNKGKRARKKTVLERSADFLATTDTYESELSAGTVSLADFRDLA